jgi:hypothetical protein
MKEKTLEECIANLSPEEREKHQILIRECLERKKLIREYTEKTDNRLEQLGVNMERLRKYLFDIEKCSMIHSNLVDILDTDFRPLLLSLENTKPSSN